MTWRVGTQSDTYCIRVRGKKDEVGRKGGFCEVIKGECGLRMELAIMEGAGIVQREREMERGVRQTVDK